MLLVCSLAKPGSLLLMNFRMVCQANVCPTIDSRVTGLNPVTSTVLVLVNSVMCYGPTQKWSRTDFGCHKFSPC